MDIEIKIPKEFLKQAFFEFLEEYERTKIIPPPQPDPRFLYSIAELAKFLNCSITTAQKIKNSGRLRFKQVGRKCVFSTAEILEDISTTRKGRKNH